MILIKDLNLLFIKGIKVAGTSFEIALSKFASKDDIVTPFGSKDEEIRPGLNIQGPINYKYTKFELFKKSKFKFINSFKLPIENYKFHEHMSALELKSVLGKDYFNSLTKVAIVRDPYSYLVSRYYWSIASAKLNGKKDISKLSFNDWIIKYPSTINENVKLIEVDDRFVIDEIIKYENFNEDLLFFEKKYKLSGLQNLFNNSKAKTGFNKSKLDVAGLYTESSLVETVYFLNKSYIEYFGYNKLNL